MKILRIRFVIPSHSSFDNKNNEVFSISIDDHVFAFEVKTSESGNYSTYTLKSDEFDFELNDRMIQKITESLYLASLEFDNGLLLNPNLKSSWIPNSFLTEINLHHNVNISDDYVGVRVMPSNTTFVDAPPLSFFQAKSSMKKFENSVNKYILSEYKNSDELIRAIEIYNSASYLNIVNQSARFILYMASVEALIPQRKVSKRLQNSLSSYLGRVKKLKLDEEEKKSIHGSLNLLKKMSIKRSGKILAKSLIDSEKKYNGFSPEDFFSKAYDLRSKFVHNGISETKELNIKNIQMQAFTSDLIKEYFNKICC